MYHPCLHAQNLVCARPMDILPSALSARSDDFKRNQEHHRALAKELSERLASTKAGGSEQARSTHTSRGKLLPRERIDRLIDPKSAFLELSTLAAWGLHDNAVPGAGMVTGIGR